MPEVVEPHDRNGIRAKRLPATGRLGDELPGDVLWVAVFALRAAKHQRVITGELERQRTAFPAASPQQGHGRGVDVDDPRLASLGVALGSAARWQTIMTSEFERSHTKKARGGPEEPQGRGELFAERQVPLNILCSQGAAR
jgi:hypothetical protein